MDKEPGKLYVSKVTNEGDLCAEVTLTFQDGDILTFQIPKASVTALIRQLYATLPEEELN